MKAIDKNTIPNKNETLKFKNIAAYVKKYALNCRYSFNNMLKA